MATDARISTALPSHPKTKKLVRQLGAEAGWSLVVLILWTASNHSDGDLAGMSDEDIELAADWDGEAGAFIAALRRIRFVDGDEGDVSIHDWEEHQPWAAGAGARSLKAKWNAVKRHHGEHAADREVPEYAAIRHAASKQSAQTHDASSTCAAESSNAPSPSPIRTLSESSPSVEAPAPLQPRAEPALGLQFLNSEGVDQRHAADWLKVRRTKKAPLTETAWRGLCREAEKARITPAEAVRWCAERSWQSFNAEWIAKVIPMSASPPLTVPSSAAERTKAEQDAAAAEFAANKAAADAKRREVMANLKTRTPA